MLSGLGMVSITMKLLLSCDNLSVQPPIRLYNSLMRIFFKTALLSSLTITALLSSPAHDDSAWAECACPPKPEPKQAFADAAVAFVGRVDHAKPSPFKKGFIEARFSILKKLKSLDELNGNTLIVLTPASADDCGYNFASGQDYLVYATGTPASLRTDSCSRTAYLDNVLEEVEQLINLSTPAATANQ